MKFKEWLVLEQGEGVSCIKGEWIYYPNGKLQYAERSDKFRGHTELVSEYYVTKYKKALFDFYNNFRNNPCVDKEKLVREERDVRRAYVHFSDFFFPPSDKASINHKNFGSMYSAISDTVSSDVYKNDRECEDYIGKVMADGLEEALGSAYSILHRIAMGHGEEELEREAMRDAGLILVRAGNNFDMYSYDKDRLISCLEAICVANQNFGKFSKNIKPNLYEPATLATTIFINTFDTGSKSVKTVTVKDLLVGETPQQAFELPASYLPVEPFSKAAVMQRDLMRQQWRQRTSESVV